MRKIIEARLSECHVMFPSFGERTTEDLPILIGLFERHLADFTDQQISAAFDMHFRQNDRFPTVSDIMKPLQPTKIYELDNGPKGFGGLYAADHPYVRLQERLGVANLESYARMVLPIGDVNLEALRVDSEHADFIPIDNTMEKPVRRSGGSEFRQLSYDVQS